MRAGNRGGAAGRRSAVRGMRRRSGARLQKVPATDLVAGASLAALIRSARRDCSHNKMGDAVHPPPIPSREDPGLWTSVNYGQAPALKMVTSLPLAVLQSPGLPAGPGGWKPGIVRS